MLASITEDAMRTKSKASAARRKARGFTMVEMLTATAVAATITAAAVPSLSHTMTRQTLGDSVANLMLAIELGRSEAIASGSRVVLAPVDGRDWRSGWRLYRDLNDNGALDGGDSVLREFPAPDRRISFAAHGVLESATMSFEEHGYIRRAGSNGLMLGRMNIALDGQVRTVCFGAARVRVVVNDLQCS